MTLPPRQKEVIPPAVIVGTGVMGCMVTSTVEVEFTQLPDVAVVEYLTTSGEEEGLIKVCAIMFPVPELKPVVAVPVMSWASQEKVVPKRLLDRVIWVVSPEQITCDDGVTVTVIS